MPACRVIDGIALLSAGFIREIEALAANRTPDRHTSQRAMIGIADSVVLADPKRIERRPTRYIRVAFETDPTSVEKSVRILK